MAWLMGRRGMQTSRSKTPPACHVVVHQPSVFPIPLCCSAGCRALEVSSTTPDFLTCPTPRRPLISSLSTRFFPDGTLLYRTSPLPLVKVAKSMARQPLATSRSAAKDSDHVYSGRYVIKVRREKGVGGVRRAGGGGRRGGISALAAPAGVVGYGWGWGKGKTKTSMAGRCALLPGGDGALLTVSPSPRIAPPTQGCARQLIPLLTHSPFLSPPLFPPHSRPYVPLPCRVTWRMWW